MKNQLHEVQAQTHSLSPAAAEIWITAVTERVTPATEIRGRLMGPQSLYASTVEVAYALRACDENPSPNPSPKRRGGPDSRFCPPLRFGEGLGEGFSSQALSPFPREPHGMPPLTRRVIIPEPSFWDPQTPLLYRAVIELWEDGERCDQAQFDLGLRTLDGGKDHKYWNGRRMTLRGTVQLPESHEDALSLRGAGYNLLFHNVSSWWPTANRLGFWMLGRVPLTATDVSLASFMSGQVSTLGWVLGKELLDQTTFDADLFAQLLGTQRLVGVELDHLPATPLPEGLAFVLCPEWALEELSKVRLPKIVLLGKETPIAETTPPEGVWGWIHT